MRYGVVGSAGPSAEWDTTTTKIPSPIMDFGGGIRRPYGFFVAMAVAWDGVVARDSGQGRALPRLKPSIVPPKGHRRDFRWPFIPRLALLYTASSPFSSPPLYIHNKASYRASKRLVFRTSVSPGNAPPKRRNVGAWSAGTMVLRTTRRRTVTTPYQLRMIDQETSDTLTRRTPTHPTRPHGRRCPANRRRGRGLPGRKHGEELYPRVPGLRRLSMAEACWATGAE